MYQRTYVEVEKILVNWRQRGKIDFQKPRTTHVENSFEIMVARTIPVIRITTGKNDLYHRFVEEFLET